MAKRRAQQVGNRDRREWRFLSERRLCATRFEPEYVRLVQMNLRRLLDHDHAVGVGNVGRQCVEECRLTGACSPRHEDVLLRPHSADKPVRNIRCQRANLHQLAECVMPGELSNRQRWTGDRTRREHRGHSRAVLETRIEQGLHVGDLVPTGARDVLDGDGQIPRLQRSIGNRLNRAVPFHEDMAATIVDHHFGHTWVHEQVLDGLQERQNAIEAAHIAPLST